MNWIEQNGITLATIFAGLSTAVAVVTLLKARSSTRRLASSRYEEEQRQNLRNSSFFFRCFEPIVDELSQWFRNDHPTHSRLDLALKHSRPAAARWTVSNFLATKTVEAAFVAFAVWAILYLLGANLLAILVSICLLLSYPWLAARGRVSEAEMQLRQQRRRLPFVVDQIALMMQAGANFEDCLRAVVQDEHHHPLVQQLAIVVNDIDSGRSRRDALLDFQNRIPDRDVRELVFAITTGEELGTPLSSILADQAEQMRLKRSQWGEKAAAEAEVQIVFPGMLVMLACLIVIVGPILLPVVFDVFGQER